MASWGPVRNPRPPSPGLRTPKSPPWRPPNGECDLDALLLKYQAQIKALQEHRELKKLLTEPEHDDVFLLRHLLSCNGSISKAASSAEQCIRWRRENAELLSQADELHHVVKEILPVGMLPFNSKLDEPIQIVMPFQVDFGQWAQASLDWHFRTGVANREVAYRLCDRMTRLRRKLIKVILMQDLSGLTWSIIYSQYRLGSVQGKLSKISAYVYPQMLSTVVIINAPTFINHLFKLAAPILSKKVMDKMRVCQNAQQICAAAHLDYEQLPSFLGGGYDWDAEWIPPHLRAAGREAAAARRHLHAPGTPSRAGALNGSGGRASTSGRDGDKPTWTKFSRPRRKPLSSRGKVLLFVALAMVSWVLFSAITAMPPCLAPECTGVDLPDRIRGRKATVVARFGPVAGYLLIGP